MPHYADGTPARIGDLVRGVGYNSKFNVGENPFSGSQPEANGKFKQELIGTVVDVKPGDSCTLTVAYVEITELPVKLDPWQVDVYRHALLLGSGSNVRALYVRTEYGDTKGFMKIG